VDNTLDAKGFLEGRQMCVELKKLNRRQESIVIDRDRGLNGYHIEILTLGFTML